MKKNLLIAAALMASLSLSAQEVGNIDPDALGLGPDAIAVTAGTVVAQSASVTMSIAFDDNYKSTSIVANDYTAIAVDGNEFFNGIQGSTNPKDANGSAPNNSVVPPVGGAALQLDVTADGYVYILHKASSHKAYTVFENGSAIGYDFAMNTANDFLGSVYRFTLEGEGEYNYVPVGDTIRWAEVYADGYADYLAANSLTQIAGGGMGYIKFPVFAGCTYIVNACGSKITCSGFYFDAKGTANVELIGETNLTIDEGGDSSAPVTFVVDDSANKTGTDFKLKGSWNTSTGAYDSGWNGGAEHTPMYDDGTHGDATAGDNIWSVTVNLIPDATVTWKWGFNINGVWGPSAPDPEFTLADATAKTVTYVIPKSTAVDQYGLSTTVVKTEYYNILGVKLSEPANGINIVKNTMSDGKIVTTRGVFRK